MLKGKPEELSIGARVQDYLQPMSPWHRRLWSIGVVLSLKEMLEAIEAVRASVLGEASLQYLADSLSGLFEADVGVGDERQRTLLKCQIKSKHLRPGSLSATQIEHFLSDIEPNYLRRWAEFIERGGEIKSVERASRAISTHLVDSGHSLNFLKDWWGQRISTRSAEKSLSNLLHNAHELITKSVSRYEVMAAFLSDSLGRETSDTAWKSATSVKAWMRANSIDVPHLRIQGGLLINVNAKDEWAAIEEAREAVDRLRARASVGRTSELRVIESLWVAGSKMEFRMERPRRGVDVRCLSREDRILDIQKRSLVDNAIELVGTLDSGPAAPAIANGWAAVESLLIAPGEGVDRVDAAERMASIVACSFPRAELTSLGHAHLRSKANDDLYLRLKGAKTNQELAATVATFLTKKDVLALVRGADKAAENRIRIILSDSRKSLLEIKHYAAQSLRRLYRQRNIVMHWGKLDSVALQATLRTVAPLVGCALDRIAHAFIRHSLSPVQLAAIGDISLNLLGTAQAKSVTTLLEP